MVNWASIKIATDNDPHCQLQLYEQPCELILSHVATSIVSFHNFIDRLWHCGIRAGCTVTAQCCCKLLKCHENIWLVDVCGIVVTSFHWFLQDWWWCCYGNRRGILWETFQDGFYDNAGTSGPATPSQPGLCCPISVPTLSGRRRRWLQPHPKTTPTQTQERPKHQTEQQLWDGGWRVWNYQERPSRNQRYIRACGG